jgi:hypothetical protein
VNANKAQYAEPIYFGGDGVIDIVREFQNGKFSEIISWKEFKNLCRVALKHAPSK